VYYDPTNESKVDVLFRKFNDSSPNNSHLNILLTTPYVNNTHFIFNRSSLLRADTLNNKVGELIDFSVNIWFYISNANNDDFLEQALLVIGEVIPSDKSISLLIAKTLNFNASGIPQFKISLKHYPTNMVI
jgi:hypothetical protein